MVNRYLPLTGWLQDFFSLLLRLNLGASSGALSKNGPRGHLRLIIGLRLVELLGQGAWPCWRRHCYCMGSRVCSRALRSQTPTLFPGSSLPALSATSPVPCLSACCHVSCHSALIPLTRYSQIHSFFCKLAWACVSSQQQKSNQDPHVSWSSVLY